MAVLGDGGATCNDRKFSWYSYCYSYSMDEPLALLSGQSWQEWCGGLYRNKVTLPRPSLLINWQNPPMLHQFTDKYASLLMVNPPKLTGLNRVVDKSGVVYTETK